MDNSGSEMLKPFRIRDLRDDRNYVGGSGSGTCDGVVQVSAPDYDTTILKHPEATLMYMDDDDGEIVCVGSSFELGQRLDEPFNLRPQHASRQALRHEILSPPSFSTMHIFDINRTNTALSVWRDFEMKDRGLSATLKKLEDSSLQPKAAKNPEEPDSDLKVHVDASDDAARLKELEDERQRWFWACNPPRMIPVQVFAPNTHVTSDVPVTNDANASMPSESAPESVSQTSPQFQPVVTPHPNSLTSEAKKQAQDAAAKFRGWKNPAIADAKVSSKYQNRWASYNQEGSFGSPDSRILSTNPDDNVSTKAMAGYGELVSARSPKVIKKHWERHNPTHICTSLNRDREACGHGFFRRADLKRHYTTHNNQEFSQRLGPTSSASSSTVPSRQYEPPSVEAESPQLSALPRRQDSTFFEAFEAEMAKMIASSTEATTLHESSVRPSEGEKVPGGVESTTINPGEVLVNTVQSLIEGVSFLGVEFKNTFPNLQRNISSPQEQLPGHVDSTVRGTLQGLGNQMGNLAKSMHNTPEVSRQAAEGTIEADLRTVEGAFEGLRGFVEGVGDMGKTLLSALEAEFSPPANARLQNQPASAQSTSSVENGTSSPQSAEQEIPEDIEVLKVVAPKPEVVAPPSAIKEVPLEGADINATTHTQSRRARRNIQLHKHHVPLEAQASHFDLEECTRGRRSLAFQEEKPEPARDGRSRSPPRRPHPFDYRRPGHLYHGGQPHPYAHPPPPFYPRFPFAASAHPIPPHLPGNLTDGRPGAPPDVPLYPRSMPPPPQDHFHATDRHRRFLYPGSRSDHLETERTSKPSVVFTDPIKPSEASKTDASKTNWARRVRSVGSLSTQFDTPPTICGPPQHHHHHHHHQQQQQQTNNSNAILDQDVADPTFSVRYPSLVANNNLRRSNTTSGRPTVSLEDSQMVRFPTLSQFEEQTHKDHLESGSKRRPEDATQSIPGSWPPPSDRPNSESSGEFFTRMTGLRAKPTEEPILMPKNQLSRSKTVTAPNPAARLLGPFDPLGSFTAFQQDDSLKRSVTDRGPHRRAFDGNRRPYSEHFSGDGRQGWESFLQQYRKTPGSFPTQDDTDSQRQYPTLPKFEPSRRVMHPGRTRPGRPVLTVDTTRPHSGPKPRPWGKAKTERCVDQLKMLGFGNEQEGGEERLMVYAEGADGNLGDAIEMIEEERKAYQQRRKI